MRGFPHSSFIASLPLSSMEQKQQYTDSQQRRIPVKNGKNPTLKQKKLIEDAGLDPRDWLVTKVKPWFLHLVNRDDGSIKVINV